MKTFFPTVLALLAFAGCNAVDDPDRSAESWKVVATSTGDEKILAIKAIREVTSLGLKDAKDLADGIPSVIVSGVSREEAARVSEKLEAAGMTVQIEPQ